MLNIFNILLSFSFFAGRAEKKTDHASVGADVWNYLLRDPCFSEPCGGQSVIGIWCFEAMGITLVLAGQRARVSGIDGQDGTICHTGATS